MESRSERAGEEKESIRARLLCRRDGTPAGLLNAAARRISDRLLADAEFARAGSVGAYASVGSEVPTGRIISEILKHGKKLYLPRMTSSTEMEFCRVQDTSELVPGSIVGSIMEPGPRAEVAARIDLVLVPAIAASYDGHRLGHGLGCYDRFLGRHRETTTVALLLEGQMVRGLPVGPRDIPMDLIMTEERTIRPRRRTGRKG